MEIYIVYVPRVEYSDLLTDENDSDPPMILGVFSTKEKAYEYCEQRHETVDDQSETYGPLKVDEPDAIYLP